LLNCDAMLPTTKKPAPVPAPPMPEDADFAEEAGPKKTEFETEKAAKALTSGGFDPIP
jgi:hypothetical protein